jgi:hypothetical protein
MNNNPHSYAESFIAEDAVKIAARARGLELGTLDASQGTGAYLRHLAHLLDAQSVVEIGTVGSPYTSEVDAINMRAFFAFAKPNKLCVPNDPTFNV